MLFYIVLMNVLVSTLQRERLQVDEGDIMFLCVYSTNAAGQVFSIHHVSYDFFIPGSVH